MIARLYLGLFALWRRTILLEEIVFKGFWLGLLSRRVLQQVDDALYRGWASYHGEEHNLRGLFDWEAAAVAEHFAGRPRLLVIGAGGGREVIALARAGYRVRGYECNPALVEVAARLLDRHLAGAEARIEWLARDAVPAAEPEFDAAIVGWSAYTLIAGRRHRVRFLTDLRRILCRDAPVLLSFFTREGEGRKLRWIARLANAARRLLGRERIELGDDLAPNFVHRFTRAEVERELGDAGFRLVVFQAQGAGPYDSGYAVARPEVRRCGASRCEGLATD